MTKTKRTLNNLTSIIGEVNGSKNQENKQDIDFSNQKIKINTQTIESVNEVVKDYTAEMNVNVGGLKIKKKQPKEKVTFFIKPKLRKKILEIKAKAEEQELSLTEGEVINALLEKALKA